jgi:hypothetical protein
MKKQIDHSQQQVSLPALLLQQLLLEASVGHSGRA